MPRGTPPFRSIAQDRTTGPRPDGGPEGGLDGVLGGVLGGVPEGGPRGTAPAADPLLESLLAAPQAGRAGDPAGGAPGGGTGGGTGIGDGPAPGTGSVIRLAGEAAGPGLSDLAGEAMTDVLSAAFTTGGEHDPDGFDDRFFPAPLDQAARDAAQRSAALSHLIAAPPPHPAQSSAPPPVQSSAPSTVQSAVRSSALSSVLSSILPPAPRPARPGPLADLTDLLGTPPAPLPAPAATPRPALTDLLAAPSTPAPAPIPAPAATPRPALTDLLAAPPTPVPAPAATPHPALTDLLATPPTPVPAPAPAPAATPRPALTDLLATPPAPAPTPAPAPVPTPVPAPAPEDDLPEDLAEAIADIMDDAEPPDPDPDSDPDPVAALAADPGEDPLPAEPRAPRRRPAPAEPASDDRFTALFADPAPAREEDPDLFDDPAPAPGRRGPPRRSAAMDDLDRVLQVGAARPTAASKWRVRLVWAVILGGLTWLAFQPYPFEVGGDFVIQPIDRAEARARTDGEITALHVTEGDWVEKDQVLAVISNWDEARDVALNRTDGDRLRAELETMQAGPRPEQVALAEEGLRAAQMQVDITARDLARQEQLFASGTIPEREVFAARDAHDLALTRRAEAEANLALVSVGALQTQIDAQLAAIARNDEELAFAELMLEYTNVRAPAAGQIVSDMATVPVGAYLSTGALFAEIEDNRTVIATINLPEITIEEVVIGAPVELRLWSAPEENILGTVRAIAPRAETSDFGPVLRVQVEVPNPEGRLAANMTGFGKIGAGERPVWEVFSRAIYRFFTIELWSWLP